MILLVTWPPNAKGGFTNGKQYSYVYLGNEQVCHETPPISTWKKKKKNFDMMVTGIGTYPVAQSASQPVSTDSTNRTDRESASFQRTTSAAALDIRDCHNFLCFEAAYGAQKVGNDCPHSCKVGLLLIIGFAAIDG